MSEHKPLTPASPTPAEHWHLAHSETERLLAEFEHALICLCEAFGRYNMQGLSNVESDSAFSGQDNSVLHIISTMGRPKSLSDISRFMNRDDLANIQYSIRKLVKAGLIEKANDRSTRGTNYRTTEEGQRVVESFVNLRRELVVAPTSEMEQFQEQIRTTTKVMASFIGIYDQAARVLTTRI